MTGTRPFQGRFVDRDLLCSTNISNLKFLYDYLITSKEDMKGSAECKNSLLGHPLGDLWVTHRVHLWLDEKPIVNFLLMIASHNRAITDRRTDRHMMTA